MENHLDRNLTLLSKRQQQLAALLWKIPSEPIEIFPSAKGLPTASYRRKDQTKVYLHSRYDPMQEARQDIAKIDLSGADYFILLGFGLGYNLDALASVTLHSDSRYFVIESDPAILKAAMQARDLAEILTLPHVHFAWPASGPELSRQWMDLFDPVRARGSVFVNHIPSIALSPDHYKSAVQIIQSQTFQIFIDINTLVSKSKVFLDNFISNLPHALASPGVQHFAGQMRNIPAILVSAGPSLDRNIHELRGCEGKVLILATDTTFKPLLAAGVTPHFVLSGDPSYENYLHLKGASTANSLLVAEATGFPEVFIQFRGRTITCTFESSSLQSFSLLLGQKGTLRAWGSVATMALDFALLLGCDPIIFVGQDLAHSEGRTYCSGLHWEEQLFADVSTPDQWKARWESLRAGKTIVTMVDIFGNPAETTDKLAAYWNWFNKEIRSHPNIRFVNATEGGILRDGVTVMSLREALYRYCSESLSVGQKVEMLFAQAQQLKPGSVEGVLALMQREAANVRKILGTGRELCARKSGQTRDYLWRDLEAVKQSIYANPHIAPLLDSLNQMGNVAFLREQASFKSTSGNPPDLAPMQKVYLDYFNSVFGALETVDAALARLATPSPTCAP